MKITNCMVIIDFSKRLKSLLQIKTSRFVEIVLIIKMLYKILNYKYVLIYKKIYIYIQKYLMIAD